MSDKPDPHAILSRPELKGPETVTFVKTPLGWFSKFPYETKFNNSEYVFWCLNETKGRTPPVDELLKIIDPNFEINSSLFPKFSHRFNTNGGTQDYEIKSLSEEPFKLENFKSKFNEYIQNLELNFTNDVYNSALLVITDSHPEILREGKDLIDLLTNVSLEKETNYDPLYKKMQQVVDSLDDLQNKYSRLPKIDINKKHQKSKFARASLDTFLGSLVENPYPQEMLGSRWGDGLLEVQSNKIIFFNLDYIPKVVATYKITNKNQLESPYSNLELWNLTFEHQSGKLPRSR